MFSAVELSGNSPHQASLMNCKFNSWRQGEVITCTGFSVTSNTHGRSHKWPDNSVKLGQAIIKIMFHKLMLDEICSLFLHLYRRRISATKHLLVDVPECVKYNFIRTKLFMKLLKRYIPLISFKRKSESFSEIYTCSENISWQIKFILQLPDLIIKFAFLFNLLTNNHKKGIVHKLNCALFSVICTNKINIQYLDIFITVVSNSLSDILVGYWEASLRTWDMRRITVQSDFNVNFL